jgi:superfamily II DNA helicase RecQ
MAESRIDVALNNAGIPDIILKPEQVKCFEYILQGYDVIAVLPTGFGKSLLYQLLPDILPTKTSQNIVIVVCPPTSIIENQLKVLNNMGINAGIFRSKREHKGDMLFDHAKANGAEDNCETPDYGQCKILFAHPEDILSDIGRKLMKSDVFQKNVVACVIDEAHCVEMW